MSFPYADADTVQSEIRLSGLWDSYGVRIPQWHFGKRESRFAEGDHYHPGETVSVIWTPANEIPTLLNNSIFIQNEESGIVLRPELYTTSQGFAFVIAGDAQPGPYHISISYSEFSQNLEESDCDFANCVVENIAEPGSLDLDFSVVE